MRECLVLEVADRELDDGVLAVLCLHEGQGLGAVARKREVLPGREQLLLLAEGAYAAHDQPPLPVGGLGDLRLACLG